MKKCRQHLQRLESPLPWHKCIAAMIAGEANRRGEDEAIVVELPEEGCFAFASYI